MKNRTPLALCSLLAPLALFSCSEDVGVPDGYCENECVQSWTPNCERDCGIPKPAAGSGGGGDAGSSGKAGGGSGSGAGASGGGSGGGGTAGMDAGRDGGGMAGMDAGMGGTGGMDAGRDGGGDAGMGGDGGDSSVSCDETASPLDEPCVLDDDLAVFVSPSGGTGASAGTMANPIALDLAVGRALARGVGRILLCNGSYAVPLVLDTPTRALEIFGGFDCSGVPWTASPSAGATVAPPSGLALRIQNAAHAIHLENLAFVAADASTPGASSVAALVQGSSDVELVDVELTAGKGADGADAATTVQWGFPITTGCTGTVNDGNCVQGKSASGTTAGANRDFMCPADDSTSGGGGGNGGVSPQPGSKGFPDLGLGAGGNAEVGVTPCQAGQIGAAGTAGVDGLGAATRGAIVSNAWTPSAGSAGAHGHVGQGGGGGGGTSTGGGGGGGAGGCGGKAGQGGGGGGASIALQSLGSTVALIGCTLDTDDAGDGGDGAAGLVGMTSGGNPGNGDNFACPGGTGGAGGRGGHGGGGAGGLSVGILYTGPLPIRTASPISTGAPGLPGQGAGTANDGTTGLAQPELLAS